MRTISSSVDLRGEPRSITFAVNGVTAHRQFWSGEPWQLGTAAFWEDLARSSSPATTLKLGESLLEEVGICLLGGYGVRKAMADAAFARLRSADVFRAEARHTTEQLRGLLLEDLGPWGYSGRYRFPNQRSERVHTALNHLRGRDLPEVDVALRSFLEEIPGIGRKTASWIVRNELGSPNVAIVDIHLVRAGIVAGIFEESWTLPRDYDLFEGAFLSWSADSAIHPTHLDSCIWGYLSGIGNSARDLLGVSRLDDRPRPVWPTM